MLRADVRFAISAGMGSHTGATNMRLLNDACTNQYDIKLNLNHNGCTGIYWLRRTACEIIHNRHTLQKTMTHTGQTTGNRSEIKFCKFG